VPRTAQITQNTSTATIEEWAKLDLEAPNSRVLRLTRVRYDDNDHPLALEEVVFALERLPGLAADGGEVLDITELAQRHGLSLSRVSERVGIVPAPKDVALHLAIAPGKDVLKLNRIVETADGQPVEWRVAYTRI
jgi:DNA-binding GntR family transcriptional regulator